MSAPPLPPPADSNPDATVPAVPPLSPVELKGAVLLLGSLFWEGELLAQDGKKGERRKEWRDDHLDMLNAKTLPGLPIRYGRRSGSRGGQFTMVLAGDPVGTAKVASLRQKFPIQNAVLPPTTVALLRQEVEVLAKAEAIWNSDNHFHWDNWGIVAVAINPTSPFADQLRKTWKSTFKPKNNYSHKLFGAEIVDENGILEINLPWAEPGLAGHDFCLSTPTVPRNPLPTPKEIAEAIWAGSYFHRTTESGIITPDDAEIRKHLAIPKPTVPISQPSPLAKDGASGAS